jgi:hypothetical protein
MSVRHLAVWLGDEHVASIEAKRPWDLRARYSAGVVDLLPK